MAEKIIGMRQELASIRAAGNGQQAAAIREQISAARLEMRSTFARMKAEEKSEQARIRSEERSADHEFAEMLRKKSERQP
jgi:hypothetical protein